MILVSGASGFIDRPLYARFEADCCAVRADLRALVRSALAGGASFVGEIGYEIDCPNDHDRCGAGSSSAHPSMRDGRPGR